MAVLVVIYTAIATCTIVATILSPYRMEPHLLSAKAWNVTHCTGSATIMIHEGGFVIGVGITA